MGCDLSLTHDPTSGVSIAKGYGLGIITGYWGIDPSVRIGYAFHSYNDSPFLDVVYMRQGYMECLISIELRVEVTPRCYIWTCK